MSNSNDKFTWHKGDTIMTVGGKRGKYVNGKFVPEKPDKQKKSKK